MRVATLSLFAAGPVVALNTILRHLRLRAATFSVFAGSNTICFAPSAFASGHLLEICGGLKTTRTDVCGRIKI